MFAYVYRLNYLKFSLSHQKRYSNIYYTLNHYLILYTLELNNMEYQYIGKNTESNNLLLNSNYKSIKFNDSYFYFNAEHFCNANGGAIPKFAQSLQENKAQNFAP